MIKTLRLTLLCLILFQTQLKAQNPSLLYQNWVDAQINNTEPILPTFSYAGYHNGEVGLPSSFSQPVFDVTNYGAVADDGISDKSAIMATIAAAEANPSGGIVFFPPGRFVVNDDAVDDLSEVIRISKSNIVIKGSGSGIGGTELYQKDNTTHPDMATKDWVCPYLFVFWNGEDSVNTYITDVVGNADRETFTLQVADASSITVGQWVELYLKDTNSALLAEELSPYTTSDLYQPSNLKIVNDGVQVREVHKVVGKSGNTITFKEPIHRAVNATYDWKINNFKALEEVGVQDLKYTGGFIWNHIHHRAPQELYPGEPVNGPNAYLSSSGWSGIQFNHVVNGWISNVEFSDMSQVAQFKFSANCTALNNRYTGNPGHNFIVTNSATGCFIGKNIDYTSGIWHGAGVNALSIGNVLWRNESPQNGNSGMEIHASQPRATLFDVCKGGFFFNQGGSTGALPNHLRHMVLWNFEGVSYQATGVKSWRPNSETRYAKFLMPIISGLQGFTMSTEANQYQENESQGTPVDEESLYEHQLEYRLGSLPSWIDEEAPSPFYPIFHYEDFGAVNRGYSVQVIANPDSQDESKIGKRISDIPDASDSNNEFTETRPSVRIPANQARDQRALSIVGTSSNTNYELEAWVVMQTVDVSTSNPYIRVADTHKYISFWTEQRYANGGISALEAYVSTDYTNNVSTATWTNVTSSLNQIATSGQNPQTYIKSVLDISAYNSSSFTLAFKYTSSPSAWSPTNRNGTFYISDVKYFVSSAPLSSQVFVAESKTIKVFPNPVSDRLYIRVADNAFKIHSVTLLNVMGKTVYKSEKAYDDIDVSQLPSGIYFLRLKDANSDNTVTKKVMIR
ncbi:DUF4955 domain-containing protein [Hwangdonia lutea]|uniref:DUF4955 domain-containing protein n=1 Tax=Hwangdonia lutea TaxID=3075823 RepID=A0AA97EK20_9FLAO|nr:DUF4955 domain-containing protein [Hwangdonia sp. SCSIO 19198]WOD42864.1 DUF4955 domain-containing protein [Hwangdonia sp. SCSIO 19198]